MGRRVPGPGRVRVARSDPMEIAPTPAPATPAARQAATLFVALELSRAKWLVGLHSPVADKISRRTVTGGDAAALLAVIDEARL